MMTRTLNIFIFVELDESGKIKYLRDKIRDKGLTIKL